MPVVSYLLLLGKLLLADDTTVSVDDLTGFTPPLILFDDLAGFTATLLLFDDLAGFTPTLLLLGSKLLLGRHFRYIFFLSINCPALAFFCFVLLLAADFFPCDDDTAGSGPPVDDRFISSSKYRRLASSAATLSRDWMMANVK